jgi:hypothetical protein
MRFVLPGFEKITDVAMQVKEESRTLVRGYVEAYKSGDPRRLKSLLDDGAKIQRVKGKGTFEKVEPVWRQLFDG